MSTILLQALNQWMHVNQVTHVPDNKLDEALMLFLDNADYALQDSHIVEKLQDEVRNLDIPDTHAWLSHFLEGQPLYTSAIATLYDHISWYRIGNQCYDSLDTATQAFLEAHKS